MQLVRPLVQTVADLGSTARNLSRMRAVAAVLVRHGLGGLVRDVPGVEVDPDAPVRTTPERVVAAIVELGPTFVKLGQVLSTRPDLLPPEYITALEKLQDDVDTLPFAAIEEVLAEELGEHWREAFARFDEAPLATASIAQVHTARLSEERGGDEVVVKVQRPGILAKVEADLQILRFLAGRAVREWPELEAADPEGLLREFARTMGNELAFRKEADNMRRFRRNQADTDWVVVPETFDELVTDRVLCMTRLQGVPIRRAREQGHDMRLVGERYLHVVFEMLLVHGFFHGDLHPGNVLVLEGDRLGLIDFGMVGTMTDKMRAQVVAMMFALQKGDSRTIARVLHDIAIKDERVDFRALEQATVEVIDTYFPPGTQLSDIEMSAFSVELVRRSASLGARVPTPYMMVLKALVTAEGLAKSLLQEVDVIAAATPFFATVAAERMAPERLQQEGLYALLTLSSLVDRLPVTLSQLLDDLDAQRVKVGVIAHEHPEQQARLDRRLSRAITAAFGVAALLAGAVAPGEPVLLGLSAATLALWLLAVGAAALSLRR